MKSNLQMEAAIRDIHRRIDSIVSQNKHECSQLRQVQVHTQARVEQAYHELLERKKTHENDISKQYEEIDHMEADDRRLDRQIEFGE